MVAISELLQGCLTQFLSLINSGALSDHTEEVPLQDWTDELGRLRVWAANIGAHQTRQSSLDYRLRDASHIRSQIVRLLEQFQELLTDLKEVFEEQSDDEPDDDMFEGFEDSESEDSTEIQEIHQGLVETINQLYQMSMIIRKPAQHDRLVGTKKLDSEPFEFWTKQHISNKYPNADALAIDRISSAMARQRAILKYRERHHAKLGQGIDSESDGCSAMLSETVVTDVFKEIPGQFNDMASDAGVSETSYGGTLLEGTGADAPKIPPIPKNGMDQRPFECPYCFYIITVRDRRAWARHIFRDLMPYVCIFPGCSTPNKLYGGRRQWDYHIQQAHATISSTDGTYHCSICKQGSLPAVTFRRHVGQHLEELALFMLPRTDPDEDENKATDENISNVSLDDHSMEQSVEQRNSMDNAPTPASDSDLSNDDLLKEPRNKSKHYTSSVGANSSDRESLGDLESNVEDKMWASFERLQREPQESRRRSDNEHEEIAVRYDSRRRMDVLESEEDYMKRMRNLELFEHEHQSAEVKERWKELARMNDETEEREKIMREERFKELIRQEEEEVEHKIHIQEIRDEKARMAREAEEAWWKEAASRTEDEEERRKIIQEIQEIRDEKARTAMEVEEKWEKELALKAAAIEEWKEAEEKRKKELALKAAAREEWNLEQERVKKRQTEEAMRKAKEFGDRLCDIGYSEAEIDTIIGRQKEKKNEEEKGKEEEKKMMKLQLALRAASRERWKLEQEWMKKKQTEEKKEETKPTWIKVHRRHLSPDTLSAYNLPWDWDEHDPNYIIIKQWIDEDFQDRLFAHTRRIRKFGQISSPTTERKVNDRSGDEYQSSRRRRESLRRGRQLERS
ncbi:hypothetical protein N7491_001766 [Penicillium cf. griseofulvum]|uniref:Oxidoreductase acuF-like C2H2 type zinc-finger domain-containing protein n=1 Tax=Penicillium cf. griseofulvum TaxID=2972120 RepID=A0A9W9JCB1_9EURO|nr:hypothetical protein N7472_006894 [Penicillium cf. griseofulvum]KAJ5445684.1 hypothetical protein N7491_001766 [Penicillium cf. griseofulvum]